MRPQSIKLAASALALGVAAGLAFAPSAHAQDSAPASAPDAAATSYSVAERELFALNLYHEARSEGRDGMIAVAWVVLNRIPSEAFPDNITDIINEPTGSACQWGWICDGRSDTPTEPEDWQLAQDVTELMLSDARPADPTGGAIAFHETFRRTPGWLSQSGTRTATLGNHHFYRLN